MNHLALESLFFQLWPMRGAVADVINQKLIRLHDPSIVLNQDFNRGRPWNGWFRSTGSMHILFINSCRNCLIFWEVIEMWWLSTADTEAWHNATHHAHRVPFAFHCSLHLNCIGPKKKQHFSFNHNNLVMVFRAAIFFPVRNCPLVCLIKINRQFHIIPQFMIEISSINRSISCLWKAMIHINVPVWNISLLIHSRKPVCILLSANNFRSINLNWSNFFYSRHIMLKTSWFSQISVFLLCRAVSEELTSSNR